MAGARVPTYQDLGTVAPQMAPNIQMQAPASEYRMADALGQGAKEEGQLAKALGDASGVGADILIKQQEVANQVRVQDALNQARQSSIDLTYGNQANGTTGYSTITGKNALAGEDGKPLSQVYGDKLNQSIGDISEGLGNDAQRRLFAEHASGIQNSFAEGVQRHTAEQFKTYQSSVADGALDLATQQAGLQWKNPQGVDDAINQAKTAVYQKGVTVGSSGNMITAYQQEAESKIRSSVIQTALDNNNPTYAMGYFNKYKGDGSGNFGGLTTNDILKVQGQLSNKYDTHLAQSAVAETTNDNLTAITPTPINRLQGIVQGMESSNQRYDANGQIVTSSEGAKGEMQVMDATNANPGFGVKPAQDSGPDERARVGRDYLTAMVQRYGGADKALAAYNAGPKALDDAMQAAKDAGTPGNWLSQLPKDTQAYVTNGIRQLNAGAGAPDLPSKLDFEKTAVTKLGADPRPEVIEKTQEIAGRQYDLLVASRDQASTQSLHTAQQQLIANGGDMTQLPLDTMAALTQYDPTNLKKAQDFAKAVANPDRPTNNEAYATAVAHPDEMAKMSDAEWVQFGTTNLSEPDFKALSKMRAAEMNGTAKDSPDLVNTKAVNSTLDERLRSIGLDDVADRKQDDDKSRYGAIQKFTRQYLTDQQQEMGRKMTPDEVEKSIDTMFSKQVITPGLLGFGTRSQPVMKMDVGDIPSKDADRIKAFYNSKGISNPTDHDVLNLFRMMEMKRGGR